MAALLSGSRQSVAPKRRQIRARKTTARRRRALLRREAPRTSESLVVTGRKGWPPSGGKWPEPCDVNAGPINEALRPQRSRGKVVAITKGAAAEPIRIEVGAETMVTASIPNEAVDALALEVGKPGLWGFRRPTSESR